MSVNSSPTMAPLPNLSVVGAFKTAPTLVKVLAASFYLSGLYLLWLAFAAFTSPSTAAGGDNVLVGVFLSFFFVLMALVGFLLGKGIARGARGTWLLSLVLCGLALAVVVLGMLGAVTVTSIVNVVILVVTLALLLTPVVRQHCTNK